MGPAQSNPFLGPQGPPGPPGESISGISIVNGILTITTDKGHTYTGNAGGPAGAPGAPGASGAPGTGIISINYDQNGNITIYTSDGKSYSSSWNIDDKIVKLMLANQSLYCSSGLCTTPIGLSFATTYAPGYDPGIFNDPASNSLLITGPNYNGTRTINIKDNLNVAGITWLNTMNVNGTALVKTGLTVGTDKGNGYNGILINYDALSGENDAYEQSPQHGLAIRANDNSTGSWLTMMMGYDPKLDGGYINVAKKGSVLPLFLLTRLGAPVYAGGSLIANGQITANAKGKPLNLTSGWQNSANDTTAEISNDTDWFKTLMVVGNSSGGNGRLVRVWDDLTVNGNLKFGDGNGAIYVNGNGINGPGNDWLRLNNNANNMPTAILGKGLQVANGLHVGSDWGSSTGANVPGRGLLVVEGDGVFGNDAHIGNILFVNKICDNNTGQRCMTL